MPAERRVLIVFATMHIHKSMFFFLLQTEYGDVFKVTLDHDNEHVTELKIKYFDTISTASAMCVMKSDGFLSAASEFRNHALYQFQTIGTDPDVESSSSTSMETDEGFQCCTINCISLISIANKSQRAKPIATDFNPLLKKKRNTNRLKEQTLTPSVLVGENFVGTESDDKGKETLDVDKETWNKSRKALKILL
ncbi:spliceosome-associated protein 130 A [Tanacetum coccineum]